MFHTLIFSSTKNILLELWIKLRSVKNLTMIVLDRHFRQENLPSLSINTLDNTCNNLKGLIMKHFFSFFVCVFIALSICSAQQIVSGYGKKITVTATPESVVLLSGTNVAYASCVSIYNSGTNEIYCLMNCTTNEFAALLATTNAICVPGNMTYAFTKIAPRQINNVVVGSLGPQSVVYVAAY
jgi:hypothetical protein